VTLSDLTIYSTLGHGIVVSGDSHHFQLLDSNMVRRPGSIYRYSSAADGIHIAQSQGYFKLINNQIANNGDDAVNIHDTLSQGITIVDSHTIRAQNVLSWRNPFQAGDLLEFRNADFTPAGFQSRIEEVIFYAGTSEAAIKLQDPVPSSLAETSILFNRRYDSGHFVIRNNTIHDNRGRGLVVQSHSGLIEGNHLLRSYYPGLALYLTSSTWGEGYGPANIIVRNNVIEGNDIYNRYLETPGNMYISAYSDVAGTVDAPVIENLLIENNEFRNLPFAALYVSSAKNAIIRNNTIVDSNLNNTNAAATGVIIVEKARDLVLTGNKAVVTEGTTSYRNNIAIDSASTKNIYADGLNGPGSTYDESN